MCVSPLCNFVALHYKPVSVHACLYLEKHLSTSVLFQCLAKLNICGLGMEVLGGIMKADMEEEKESCSQVREL